MKALGNRIRKDQKGFTLPEVLVTIMILTIVLFSLYGIFDMSIRVFSFGNDKVEATENARLGLEKMSREIRAAYPCDATDNNAATDHVFLNPTATDCSTPPVMPTGTQIIFANDLSADNASGYRKVDIPAERITYFQSGSQLMRSQGGGAPQPVVESVASNGLQFTNLGNNGNPYTGSDPNEIAAVRVSLTITVAGDPPRTQDLTTEVDLRNNNLTSLPATPADATPPDTILDAAIGPPAGSSTTNTSANFAFISTEADSTFECSLSGAAFSACSSQQSYTGLAPGSYTFSVRAIDAAGNADGSPATRAWTITAPTPQCSDGIDNGPRPDGKKDFGGGPNADKGCSSASDNSENQRPIAANQNYTVDNDVNVTNLPAPGVLVGSSDPDSDSITVITNGPNKYTQPKDSGGMQRGTVILNANGSGSYDPPNNFVGTVTFTYTISDGKDGTDTATVTFTVTD